MYTQDDALDKLLEILNVQALQSAISGTICTSDARPPGDNQDVVLGHLSGTDNSGENNAQLFSLNVNIYVTDINAEFPEQYASIPDKAKLKAIQSAVILLLNGNRGVYWKNGSVHITNFFGPFKSQENKQQHYYNIRLRMKMYSNE